MCLCATLGTFFSFTAKLSCSGDGYNSKEPSGRPFRMFESLWHGITFQLLCMSSSPDGYLDSGSRTTPDGPNWQASGLKSEKLSIEKSKVQVLVAFN